MSQATLGAHIGRAQNQVSRFMRGLRVLDVEELAGMCDALGLDFEKVMAAANRERR